jgi:hypothetical protein
MSVMWSPRPGYGSNWLPINLRIGILIGFLVGFGGFNGI